MGGGEVGSARQAGADGEGQRVWRGGEWVVGMEGSLVGHDSHGGVCVWEESGESGGEVGDESVGDGAESSAEVSGKLSVVVLLVAQRSEEIANGVALVGAETCGGRLAGRRRCAVANHPSPPTDRAAPATAAPDCPAPLSPLGLRLPANRPREAVAHVAAAKQVGPGRMRESWRGPKIWGGEGTASAEGLCTGSL